MPYFFYQTYLGKAYPVKSISHPLDRAPEGARRRNISAKTIFEISIDEFKALSLKQLMEKYPRKDV